MLGYAATVKIRGSAPPTTDQPYTDRTDWWDYILSVPAPRVVVVQDVATRPGLGSLDGAVHMSILQALHCTGVITNGSVRDIPTAASAGFHLFAGSVSVSHAYVHIVEIGTPVELAGLKINSGDLLHGDIHGVQSIPLPLAPQIPAVAAKLTAREQAVIALCRSREFSLDKLRTAVSKETH
jgi:regulator of RNase E activity RraA